MTEEETFGACLLFVLGVSATSGSVGVLAGTPWGFLTLGAICLFVLFGFLLGFFK